MSRSLTAITQAAGSVGDGLADRTTEHSSSLWIERTTRLLVPYQVL